MPAGDEHRPHREEQDGDREAGRDEEPTAEGKALCLAGLTLRIHPVLPTFDLKHVVAGVPDGRLDPI